MLQNKDEWFKSQDTVTVTCCAHDRGLGKYRVKLADVGFVHGHGFDSPNPSPFDRGTPYTLLQEAQAGNWSSAFYVIDWYRQGAGAIPRATRFTASQTAP